jgi:hypothetical protein
MKKTITKEELIEMIENFRNYTNQICDEALEEIDRLDEEQKTNSWKKTVELSEGEIAEDELFRVARHTIWSDDKHFNNELADCFWGLTDISAEDYA